MKRFVYLMLLLSFVFISCEKDKTEVQISGRTLFVYTIAENNLESDISNNIAIMLKGLASVGKSCRLVVYWDGNSGNPKLSEYTVEANGIVSQEKIQRTYDEQNSASLDVMKKVFEDMFRLNPSESYGLIMSSHATGWLPADTSTKFRSFGQDGKSKMEIPDLATALSAVISKPFDYILFDACLMSDVEVAYELRNVTDYLIASPAEVLAEGFPFIHLMSFLYSDKVSDYTIKLPQAFIDYYKSSWGTIATIKCDEMENLAGQVKEILIAHADELQDFNVTTLQRYDRPALGYTYSTCDLKDFITTLTTSAVPESFFKQLDKTIVYKDFAKSDLLFTIAEDKYSGIGIYIPQANKPRWNTFLSKMAWYEAAGWNQVGW